MNVGELRESLNGVPDDVDVEIEQESSDVWRYYDASSAYATTTQVGILTKSPRTIPVFRIDHS